jgi:hypothetical protein
MIYGKCYMRKFTSVYNYFQAMKFCYYSGASLPTFSSVDELNAVISNAITPSEFWIGGLSYGSTNNNNSVHLIDILGGPAAYLPTNPKWPSPNSPSTRCVTLQASIDAARSLSNLSWTAPPNNNAQSSLSCLQTAIAQCYYFPNASNCSAGWHYYQGTQFCYSLIFNVTFFEAVSKCYAACGSLNVNVWTCSLRQPTSLTFEITQFLIQSFSYNFTLVPKTNLRFFII